MFDAIIFATVCCGFVPRSALESGNVAEPRFERITRALFSSKYSIHDLSRCPGEGEEGLARFNMPYLRFVSDLGAFDPATHDGSVAGIVPKVMSWLAGRPDAIRTPTPHEVLAALPRFQERRHRLGANWSGEVPWHLVLEAAAETIPKL